MSNLTLNKIIQKLKTFTLSHPMVKDFKFEVINEVGETSPKYPLIYFELSEEASQIDETTESFSFDCAVLDRPNKSNEFRSTQEVLSDTKLVSNDIVSFFTKTRFEETIIVQLPVTFSPLINSGENAVSGWTFKLNLTLNQGLNACQIPA